jgi:hypothetical protein
MGAIENASDEFADQVRRTATSNIEHRTSNIEQGSVGVNNLRASRACCSNAAIRTPRSTQQQLQILGG